LHDKVPPLGDFFTFYFHVIIYYHFINYAYCSTLLPEGLINFVKKYVFIVKMEIYNKRVDGWFYGVNHQLFRIILNGIC